MKNNFITCLCLFLFGYAHSIHNGEVLENGSAPYQALVEFVSDFGDGWTCSGALISERFVLVSSKCSWSGPTSANVHLGVNDIDEQESTRQDYNKQTGLIKNVGSFIYDTLENNIALIKITPEVKVNDYVQVIKTAVTDTIKVGQTGFVTGYGQSQLRRVNVTVVDNSICAEAYPNTYTGPKTICVQGSDGSSSACNGDGGAPLIIDGELVGIYSGGPAYMGNYDPKAECEGKPNIFTKVSSYRDFIDRYVG